MKHWKIAEEIYVLKTTFEDWRFCHLKMFNGLKKNITDRLHTLIRCWKLYDWINCLIWWYDLWCEKNDISVRSKHKLVSNTAAADYFSTSLWEMSDLEKLTLRYPYGDPFNSVNLTMVLYTLMFLFGIKAPHRNRNMKVKQVMQSLTWELSSQKNITRCSSENHFLWSD
jgi:hypothetical protein